METDKKNEIEISQKNQDISTYFGNDTGFIFVFKKTEKLVSAVYIVTGLFSDNEPIKWSLRKRSSDLMSFIFSYKDSKDQNKNDFVFHSKTKILEIVSLMEICFNSGLISEMNFNILKQEFVNLIENLSTIQIESADPEHSILTPEFLNLNMSLPAIKDQSYYKGNLQKSGHLNNSQLSHRNVRDNIRNDTPGDDNINTKKSNRQALIISVLRKRSNLTIKDIADNVKDCSEKTIQRELNSLIETGLIKRDGERRWSRYSLS
jgi:hypothetical protein